MPPLRIATARFSQVPPELLAVRVSLGRGSGRVDAVLPEGMPSPDLLDRYKHGRVSWEEYVPEYLGSLEWYAPRLRAAVAELLLRAEAEGRDGICLLCYEASPDHCHRRLLQEFLSSGCLSGYEVEFPGPR